MSSILFMPKCLDRWRRDKQELGQEVQSRMPIHLQDGSDWLRQEKLRRRRPHRRLATLLRPRRCAAAMVHLKPVGMRELTGTQMPPVAVLPRGQGRIDYICPRGGRHDGLHAMTLATFHRLPSLHRRTQAITEHDLLEMFKADQESTLHEQLDQTSPSGNGDFHI